MNRWPAVGNDVIFHDTLGRPHHAIVTAVHGDINGWKPEHNLPCVNLVFTSSDDSKQDQYGRQLERASSVVHKKSQGAHGYYYRYEDEEPNPVAVRQS